LQLVVEKKKTKQKQIESQMAKIINPIPLILALSHSIQIKNFNIIGYFERKIKFILFRIIIGVEKGRKIKNYRFSWGILEILFF
jgi:hypothetical protein